MGSNKGFTIIEIIVSLAIIAIISGGIFNMFETAVKVNVKANTIDRSSLIATSKVEEIKKDPLKFLKDRKALFQKKYYDVDHKPVAEIKNAHFIEEELNLTDHYDSSWNLLNSGNGTYKLATKVTRKKSTDKMLAYNEANNMYENEYTVSDLDNTDKYLLLLMNNPHKSDAYKTMDPKDQNYKYAAADYVMYLFIAESYASFAGKFKKYQESNSVPVVQISNLKSVDEWRIFSNFKHDLYAKNPSSNREVFIITNKLNKDSDGVPVGLDFAELCAEHKEFYVDVINLINKPMNYYSYLGANHDNKVSVHAYVGTVNVTTTTRRQHIAQTMYTFSTQIIRSSDGAIVAECSGNRYVSEEKDDE